MQSEWGKTEIWHARQREVKAGKRVLFPIRMVSMEAIKEWRAFDEETGKDMARKAERDAFRSAQFRETAGHELRGVARRQKDLP